MYEFQISIKLSDSLGSLENYLHALGYFGHKRVVIKKFKQKSGA